MRWSAVLASSVLVLACAQPTAAPATSTDAIFLIDSVRQRFSSVTIDEARRGGYELDRYCLDATSFGLARELGAMGYHATDVAILRGPIAVERPQALMFDATGRVLGVEYEVLTDAVKEAPRLFGRTFTKLPPHAGVAHEHYALHLWLVPNPAGQFADFNPSVSCPTDGSPPGPRGTSPPTAEPEHGPGH
jgi:hypothetical protein